MLISIINENKISKAERIAFNCLTKVEINESFLKKRKDCIKRLKQYCIEHDTLFVEYKELKKTIDEFLFLRYGFDVLMNQLFKKSIECLKL